MPTPRIGPSRRTGLMGPVGGGEHGEPGGQHQIGERQHAAPAAAIDRAPDARADERGDQERHARRPRAPGSRETRGRRRSGRRGSPADSSSTPRPGSARCRAPRSPDGAIGLGARRHGRRARSWLHARGHHGLSERQADVILGERGRGRARAEQVVELGELHLLVERRRPGRCAAAMVIHHEKRSAFQTRASARLGIVVEPGVRLARGSARSAPATGSARRWPRGSGPWRRSAARCGRRRRRGTAGRSASARRRSCAAARCSSRSTAR